MEVINYTLQDVAGKWQDTHLSQEKPGLSDQSNSIAFVIISLT